MVVFITANANGEATQISRLLIEQKQATCINIIPEVASRFWWRGEIDTAAESLLVVKTKASKLPEIIRLVKSIHSNTVPEIIALPIVGGNQDYLEWIYEELS